jgi:hypothetical protein
MIGKTIFDFRISVGVQNFESLQLNNILNPNITDTDLHL